MKVTYLIKAIPFLSSLLIILILNINNQKESTRLKILIWNTPSLSLGTYLSLSIGSGFLFSYLYTTKLAKLTQSNNNNILNYKNEKERENEDNYMEFKNEASDNNLLIERDINEPSPTINASFRVIGKVNKNINNLENYQQKYEKSTFYSENSDEQYYSMANNNKNDINSNLKSIDWNNEDFLDW